MTDFNLNNHTAEVGTGFGKSDHRSIIFRRFVTWRDGGGGVQPPISPSSLYTEMANHESDFGTAQTAAGTVVSSWQDLDSKMQLRGFSNPGFGAAASNGPTWLSSVAPKSKPALGFLGATSGVSGIITDASAVSGSFWVAVCVSAPNAPASGIGASACLLDSRNNTNFGVRLFMSSGVNNRVVWSPSNNLNYEMTSGTTSALINGLGIAEFIFDQDNNEISFWWNGVNWGIQRNSNFSNCNFITSSTSIGNLFTGSTALACNVFATFIAPYAPTVAHRKRLLKYWDHKYLTGSVVTR